MKRTLSIADIKKELQSLSMGPAMRLWRDNRVYKLRALPGEGWTGLVLNQQGIPYQAWWHEAGNTLEYRCECASPLPCVHVLALGYALDQRSEVRHRELKSFLHKDSEAKTIRAERKVALARGQGSELDLFDEGLDQPSLFDAPPPRPAAAPRPVSPDPEADSQPRVQAPGTSPAGNQTGQAGPPEPLDAPADDSFLASPGLPLPASRPATADPVPQGLALPPEAPESLAPRPVPPAPPIQPATPEDPAPLAPAAPPAAAAPADTLALPADQTQAEDRALALDAPVRTSAVWSVSLHPSFPHRPELVAELRKGDPLYGYDFDQPGAAWWQTGNLLADLAQDLEHTKRRRLPLGEVLTQAWKRARQDGADPLTVIRALPLQGMGRSSGQAIPGTGLEVHARPADRSSRDTCILEARLTGTGQPGPDSSSQADSDLVRPLVQWVAEGAWIYWFRARDAALFVLNSPEHSRWVRQAQAPGRVLPGAQALALRERGLAVLGDSLVFPPPQGEESLYEVVPPRPILSLQGSGDRTEVFLSFGYKGVETSFRDEADFVTRRLGSGVTLIHPRDRAVENRHLMEVKQLLEDLILFEGGLYAGLVSSGPVADFSLNAGFADFLVTWGKTLMDQGYDLRYEGSPIRSAGGISFRAESEMDWFGLRAQWTEAGRPGGADGQGNTDDSPGNLAAHHSARQAAGHPGPDQAALPAMDAVDRSLMVDEHLDSAGLAMGKDAGGRDCWILLGQRDLDRLKVLRTMGMDKTGLLETSPVNLTLIESLYEDIENKDDAGVQKAESLRQELERVHPQWGSSQIPAALTPQPAGLRADLRSYQLVGYNWLLSLNRHQLGGCLADDMGLGKTVQTIALLQQLKETGRLGPSLLITPVVTLANWEEEVARFAPDIRLYRHTGATRVRSLDELFSPRLDDAGTPDSPHPARPDLILVSYHTLRNDLDLFVTQVWDYVILDEAHYIKNASSQLFKAVKVLQSHNRLSLTGTPIENSTMELWSQFNFLNPGLLGSRRHFQSNVAAKIEKDADEEVRDQLRDTIRPFLLRRRKEEVLKDLPPKEEILYWTEMDKEQEKLYTAHREEFKARLSGLIDRQGLENSRMEVLRFMLRLRQLAVHPGMIKNADGVRPFAHIPGCKQEALSMLLDESVQEDHKILVFSQFVSALRLLGEQLDIQGRRYQLLSGETRDRGAMVKRFRDEADLRIFLLSLKAGGVGINLTQADYVVLFDPWWNPAAEQQAVDRAHRMGQKRPVIVYKFITRGTIEEQILLLQQKKHNLAGSLISGEDEAVISQFDETEVMELFSPVKKA